MLFHFDTLEHKRVFHLNKDMDDKDVVDHFYKNKYNVFVYCSAKCGSTNIHETLLARGIKNLHTHGNFCFKDTFKVKYSVFDLIDYYTNLFPQETFYFIDSYRTPIERKISSFFQNNEKFIMETSTEDLVAHFNKLPLYLLENYHSIDQLLINYGVPLFREFDFQKGYNVVKKDNKVFVKLLSKNINEWDVALGDVLGVDFCMKTSNQAQDKIVGKKYKEFKEIYKVPAFYLDSVLPYDTHFQIYNTEQDKEKYLKEWREKSFDHPNSPVDFDPQSYGSINKDLAPLSLHDRSLHYMIHGIKENRRYK
jgi:hypothetical protein